MLKIGTKYEIRSGYVEEAIMERLNARGMSLSHMASWASQLATDSKNFLDITAQADGVLELVAMPGSDVGSVARGMYNFAIHFDMPARCTFNGYIMEVKSDGK